jgi:NAD(P)-dependent dehydrogenase (short-subunit alcohol dehydrogenase family)
MSKAGAAANPFALQGASILIFGAASGIGASAATTCAALGANLILADIVDAVPLAERLHDDGRSAVPVKCDVTDRAAVERVAADAGAIDAMIVCSGICPFNDWMDADWDQAFERTNAVNVKGAVNCVRAALPSMMAREQGRIVLVGSLAGRTGGLLSGPHYVASKGAIGALVRWFARIGAPRNVLVNGVAPGPVNTSMIAGPQPQFGEHSAGTDRRAGGGRRADRVPLLAGRKLHLRRDARRQRRRLYVLKSSTPEFPSSVLTTHQLAIFKRFSNSRTRPSGA